MIATNETRRLFDINAAVAYLRSIGADGATTNFVRSLIANAEVPCVRMGRKFYISRDALDRWIANHDRRRAS
jgi:excisionase family DNA binding protein